MTKLTLSVNEDVVEQAKRIARRNGTSVSAMFGRFVRGLSMKQQEPDTSIPAGSIAARATGIIKLPNGESARDVLTDALMDKYGINR